MLVGTCTEHAASVLHPRWVARVHEHPAAVAPHIVLFGKNTLDACTTIVNKVFIGIVVVDEVRQATLADVALALVALAPAVVVSDLATVVAAEM